MGVDRTVSVTPASSYNLIDLATLKTLLNITDSSQDAYLSFVIPQASASVANYCNRKLVVETVVETIWPQQDGPWSIVRGGLAPLQLTNWPIVAVTSVVETVMGTATTLTAGTDFTIDNAKGQLIRFDSNGYPCRWKPNMIVASYSAGFATIPFDVVDATARLVKSAYFARDRDPNIRSEMIPGVAQFSYWQPGSGAGSNGNLPPDIQALLDNYRVPVVSAQS